MLDTLPSVRVVSEAASFIDAHLLYKRGLVSHAQFRRILRAVFRVQMKTKGNKEIKWVTAHKHTTYIAVKTHSSTFLLSGTSR